MTKVKMKAVDTMHITSAGPDNIAAGETFEVNETEAKQLEDRGLATRVGGKAEAKSESAAPANKAEAADPDNKTISARTAPARPARRGSARKG